MRNLRFIYFLPIAMIMLSCRNIVVYKNQFYKDYIIREGQHFELFYYPGKDGLAKSNDLTLEDKEVEKEYYLKRNNVDVLIENDYIVYNFIDGTIDTLFMVKGKMFNKNYILPFNFSLDYATVSNQMYVVYVDTKVNWVVSYQGDSIHYFNNQKPIKTYIFNYYPFRADTRFEDYTEPITYHISSEDGMVVAVDYYRRDDIFDYVEDTTSTLQLIQLQDKTIDYRVFHCNKKKLKKYLM